nr:carbohydrate-binding family 9-like protein [uncultured Dyadobacter sp.]
MVIACRILLIMSVMLFAGFAFRRGAAEENVLIISKTDDFQLTGTGADAHWKKAEWITIPPLASGNTPYPTKTKVLYSQTGIYFLFVCTDKKITATMQADFLDLWNEDVIEIFMQPDTTVPAYFEYELSPLNYELPISIYNEKGKLNSWIPFHYEAERKTRHAVTVQGGAQKSHAAIDSWTSEIFIPYQLLKPLLKALPASGTRWKGNLYRIDYDKGETLWAWRPNSGNFHEYEKFGILHFE